MALHSSAENWIKLVKETDEEFQPTWDYIKPLFKELFGKKMDVAKVGTVLESFFNNHSLWPSHKAIFHLL